MTRDLELKPDKGPFQHSFRYHNGSMTSRSHCSELQLLLVKQTVPKLLASPALFTPRFQSAAKSEVTDIKLSL